MANYITVDGGTTNTRVSLVIDGKIFETKKNSVGARAGIDGTSAQRIFIRDAIKEMLSDEIGRASCRERVLFLV